MPRKVRELIKDLVEAGFVESGGKGSHRKFIHVKVTKIVVLSGQLGDDARRYQEKAIRTAIKESQR
jgi:predicted RNA binding protein YcfA (HicA-like mRNA interferase family)